jgi:hypothetical protein
MNLGEYRQLLSEKRALEKLLTELPTDRVIERLGLDSRREDIERCLAEEDEVAREPIRARLTFRGRPVVGSYGIFAEFGALAVNAFTEAVTAIGASQSKPLGSRGALPDRESYQLLITGTTLGSFGFQLEEAPADNLRLFPEDSLLESAIKRAQAIMQATLGTDDELTEALSDADPRALDALRKFLETMEKSEAVCALEFDDDVFRFADVAQVRRSVSRLSNDNIREEDETITGHFQGVLPDRGTFEFRKETGEIIVGKVGKEIEDPASINNVLEKLMKITVHTRRVGEGRPTYRLLRHQEIVE